MSKFKIGDQVRIKNLDKHGIITAWNTSRVWLDGTPFPTIYRVKYEENCYDYLYPLAGDCVVKKSVYVDVLENELSPHENSEEELIKNIRKQWDEQVKKMTNGFRAPIIGPGCECGMEKHNFANHSAWCPKA